jgi:hypothetical protein
MGNGAIGIASSHRAHLRLYRAAARTQSGRSTGNFPRMEESRSDGAESGLRSGESGEGSHAATRLARYSSSRLRSFAEGGWIPCLGPSANPLDTDRFSNSLACLIVLHPITLGLRSLCLAEIQSSAYVLRPSREKWRRATNVRCLW